MGNVGSRLTKKEEECVEYRKGFLWFCCIDFDHLFFKPSVNLTRNATSPLSDITIGNLTGHTASSGAKKDFILLFFDICSSTPL